MSRLYVVLLALTTTKVKVSLSELLWSDMTREATAVMRVDMGDMVYSEHEMWRTVCKSLVQCAQQCFSTPGCSAFTVTHVTSSLMTCRGYSMTLDKLQSGVPSPGTRAYDIQELSWLDKECTTDWECSNPKSVCLAGRCLCSPGYFYSHSARDCWRHCPEEDISLKIVAYPGWYAGNMKLNTSLNMAATSCVQWCRDVTACRGCLYDVTTNSCFLGDVTASVDGVSESTSRYGFNYYQKTCA
ncbi:uncharacterized protein LOC112559001 isoform X2 [Pomacea canaliculata]|uniref:uncharacterized protein LOC112559001 isoform X2 n=1 Tax=Pomacea canaliculata TaxID=400727 RepID=UPI000D7357D9|nr:uncharacterized protein LOC112559001 isoform X2 [Pomacea canaliculata]